MALSRITEAVASFTDLTIGDDLTLTDDFLMASDASIIKFGADADVTLTHVHNTGLLLNSTSVIQFNDASQNIGAPSATVLDINATDEIELNATLIDVNGNLDVSGTIVAAGALTAATSITIGSAALTEAELELLDGITAGTAAANKAVVLDGSKNIATIGTIGSGAITSSGTIQGTTITATTAFVPDASDGAALGTTALEFSDLFLADASTIQFGADQDVTLTHVADTGILLNGSSKIQFTNAAESIHSDGSKLILTSNSVAFSLPTADGSSGQILQTNGSGVLSFATASANTPSSADGQALGSASLEWSDLFLADGGTIQFGNDQDVTLTHVADTGLLLNTTMKLQFRDAAIHISSTADGDLSIAADDEIDLTSTLIDINGNATVSGTLGVTGVVTANAGVVVDNITIDGTEIDLSTGDLTLDIASDLIIDVGDGRIFFKDDGTTFGRIENNSTNLDIVSVVADKDIIFKGNDGGSEITALTLDMSDAGSATFSHNVKLPDNGVLALGAGSDLSLSSNGTNGTIAAPNGTLTIDVAGDITLDAGGGDIFLKNDGTQFGTIAAETGGLGISSAIVQDSDILFKGNDGGSTITALTLDMSASGDATFNGQVIIPQYLTHQGDGDTFLEFVTNQINLYAGNKRQLILGTGEVIINQDSADVDFRVETDGNANTLFIEGSSNNISIGHSPPTIASGNGVHLADSYFIGFGVGNGTRPDFQVGQDTSTNTLAFRCGTGADTIDLSINTSGVFSGDFNDTSDERLKENIQDIADNQINIVKQLRPVTFDWKEDGKGADTGFIAQEVVKLLPNDVHTSTGLDDDSQLGINSLGLIATLTKALQEAITKIETLEAKVTTLENA